VKGRDLARVRRDEALRALAPGDTAAARAARGRALVDAALRGEIEPQDLDARAAVAPAVRAEETACASCYRPHEAPPGTVCPACAGAMPQDLEALSGRPPDP